MASSRRAAVLLAAVSGLCSALPTQGAASKVPETVLAEGAAEGCAAQSGMSLLQTAGSVKRTASAGASQDPIPILAPNSMTWEGTASDWWPFWVEDNEDSLATEKVCHQAFQQAYDCTFYAAYDREDCICPGPAAGFEEVVNCHNFFGYAMTGSWLMPANQTNSVPKHLTQEERSEFCNEAYHITWDCFAIPPYKGGAKGGCWLGNCWRWFGSCMGFDRTSPAPYDDRATKAIEHELGRPSTTPEPWYPGQRLKMTTHQPRATTEPPTN